MKPSLKYLSLILILCISLASCKKQSPVKLADEVKVNDFQTLSSQFSTPPAEYTTAPFFVWNAEITKDEIDKDLKSFKDAGSSQVFVHPRPGLITEYLSTDWFELYKYTVDKGKEMGMNVWIYDENSYPSGFGGGHVPDVMPESYNQGQGLRMTRFETLPDTADKYYLCLKEEEGKYIDITNLVSEKGKTGKYILFSKTYNGKSPWYGGFSYVDLLYPGVTQKFIETTMTGYEKNIGTEFGKTVPGTFTDEPQINSPGGIRFTPDLFDVFMEEWHYDLKTQLPSLYEEVGDWKRVRHNYTQTLLNLFIDRWAKPWYEYCEAKGLKFTGHYWEHEWPNMRPGGDNMAMYIYHHVPAVDMLFNQYNDRSPRAQFGNVRAIKELASAANQSGRQRKLSETYGGSGWELNFTDMKRNGDWEYALGVNLMNQHLTYFTMAGARKYDYPPTFDYHEPWWNDYKYINDHYARLSLALSSGKQVNDILILEPTTTAWLYDSYAKRNPRQDEIGQSFQTFVTTLEKNQVEYDLGSEEIIRQLGDAPGKKMVVGNASYSRVVIPPMTENLNIETYKLLEKFVTHGGILIAFSKPLMVDGAVHEGLKQFYTKNVGKIIVADSLTPGIMDKYLKEKSIVFSDVTGGDLYHQRRILADGQTLFLINSSTTDSQTGTVSISGKGAIEMNTITGKIEGYPSRKDGENVSLSWNLPPAGSLLLFIPASEVVGYEAKTATQTSDTIKPASPLTVTRDEANAIMIDFCDLALAGETTADMHTFYAADKVFKYYGFRNGNPWNTSVQFKKNTVERDTFGVRTGFTATYKFFVKEKFDYSGMKAVIERPSLWSVTLNGTEIKPEEGKWWLDRSFAVFNIESLVRTGENVLTLKASPMKVHAEIEPVYITGNFSVVPAEKGWKLASPAKTYTTGSWKKQALPYYSWGMTYTSDFNIDKSEGRYEVAMGKWNGTIAEVIVNGEKAGIIAFPPYTADVTGLLKPGINKIGVKVIGSLKNLMGPHHNNPAPGLTSPGSWRNVKAYPKGEDYQMLDYGLFEEFTLRHGK
jgi:hypothetical protein